MKVEIRSMDEGDMSHFALVSAQNQLKCCSDN